MATGRRTSIGRSDRHTGYKAEIILDSVAPNGRRLTTLVARYPRFVHSELMTHRVFSRNAASSRAIPIKKQIQRVLEDPVMPVWWGKNQQGMQAEEELEGDARENAILHWLTARDLAVQQVETLDMIGLHKQLANRLLEPWMWIETIITSNFWANFFHLRRHKKAQPELKHIAEMVYQVYNDSVPQELEEGDWHLPFLLWTEKDEFSKPLQRQISVARCARVSYLTHDGNLDPQADIALFERLMKPDPEDEDSPVHASAFEHVAYALGRNDAFTPSGNFVGFYQYRKDIPKEAIMEGYNGIPY